VHFSSQTDLWATPQWLYDKLDLEFHFTVDLCATPENAKCAAFFSRADNGLVQTWTGTCWLNPPYGRQIGRA
jgi:phage N-6-adenine-methyltransferase